MNTPTYKNNLSTKLVASLLFFVLVAACAGYYELRTPLPFDEKNPDSMQVSNIKAQAKRGNSDAQYVLATLYAHGDRWKGIEQDDSLAQEWMDKAAQGGNALAAYTLGEALQKKDNTQSEKYYLMAIEKGFPPAFFAYGQFKLRQGKDLQKALEYIYTGANLQDPNAMAFLASLLHEGAGLKKDPVGAILWLQKAIVVSTTEDKKAEWTAHQEAWTKALNNEESAQLTEMLMTGAIPPGDLSTKGMTAVDSTAAMPFVQEQLIEAPTQNK